MDSAVKPTDVDEHVGWFDRFAGRASDFSGRAPFFFGCVMLIVIWAPSYPVWGNGDTWQLVINTTTTIVTFLLVALLQNSQTRGNAALQHKLNAIADGLADMAEFLADGEDGDPDDLRDDIRELKSAVGLERRESTD
jgi:hypothetical protein